jgi:single-strand DNA-binding protein
MSRGINKVILVATLAADPETRYTPSGTAIASARAATNEEWKDKNTGEKQSRTEWHRIEFFGRLAEIAGEYLKKGSQVYIEGKLRTDEYEKDGIKRWSTKIIADQMQMIGGKPGEQSPRQERPARGAQSAPSEHGGALDSEEIPFAPRGKRNHWE